MTQVVGGSQCWPRSAAGPDVVCIEGQWQTATAASGGWRELWEEYTTKKVHQETKIFLRNGSVKILTL